MGLRGVIARNLLQGWEWIHVPTQSVSRTPAANSQEKQIQTGSGLAACFWGGGKNRGAKRKAKTGGGPAQMQHSQAAITWLLGLSSGSCIM